jgi:photosystem II PsbU protein
MRFFLLVLSFAASAMAFSPLIQVDKKTSSTQLGLKRRDLLTGIAGLVAAPSIASAGKGSTWFFKDKDIKEESQMATDGKLDLNGAFVVRTWATASLPSTQRSTNQSCALLISSLLIMHPFNQGDYKQLPGMFPHAAGQIASHGPYKSIKDVYKIKTLTKNDKEVIKYYEKFFTVNPPGRVFDERINSRVST